MIKEHFVFEGAIGIASSSLENDYRVSTILADFERFHE